MASDFKLVTSDAKPERTLIRVRDQIIGGERFIIMAGPCAVESREQVMEIAERLHRLGVPILRGGAFKPRTSPYAFQGLGEEGLKILAEAREKTGMPIVTEVLTAEAVPLVERYADILQIGARNMQNFELLRACGEARKPVLLKRGLAATLEEFLGAAEYILYGGNQEVMLCERGIRTFSNHSRFTLDLSVVPILKEMTHLPVIVDPSHGMGNRKYVPSMALAAIAAGADGVIIETHPHPEKALCDGAQSLLFDQMEKLVRDLEVVAPVVNRQLAVTYKQPTGVCWEVTPGPSPSADSIVVAYQGEPGAFSEKAALQFFGEDARTQPLASFRSVFEKVAEGTYPYGVVPIENSLAGSIHENFDLLLEYDVAIVGELKVRIIHNLIAHPGTRIADIRKVFLHYQAAAQCRDFLQQYPDWEVRQVYDTAGAVKLIKDQGLKDAAAIASFRAAQNYGLTVLKEGVESDPRNYTRFLILSARHLVNEHSDKTSIIFSTPDTPGALLNSLKVFSDRNINLVKLESRPIAGKPFEYMFYADLAGSMNQPGVAKALDEVGMTAEFLKVLGSYSAARS